MNGGRRAEWLMKNVEKQTDPTDALCLRYSSGEIPAKESEHCQDSLPAESLGQQPCPAMRLLCGSREVQTLRGFLSEPRKITRVHIRTSGTVTMLGTHLTVHLVDTWFSSSPPHQISLITPLAWQCCERCQKKNNPKELVLGSFGCHFSF